MQKAFGFNLSVMKRHVHLRAQRNKKRKNETMQRGEQTMKHQQ